MEMVAPDVELRSIEDLMAAAGVSSVADLSDWFDDRMDLESAITEQPPEDRVDGFDHVVRIGNLDVGLEFPTTLARFWEDVLRYEVQIIEQLDAQDDGT